MDDKILPTFEPAVVDLQKTIAEYKTLAIRGWQDKEGYEAVKKARLSLRSVRTAITTRGKELRADALARQRKIKADEDTLVALVREGENYLVAQEEEYVKKNEMEKIKTTLPQRLEELAKVGVELSEEEILVMDYDQFNAFIAQKKQEAMDAKEAELKAREAEIQAKENAMIEAEEKKKREAELEEAKRVAAEKATQQTEERLAKEALQKKEVEEAEQKKLQQKAAYQDWLQANNYNAETDITQKTSEGVVLYRRVSTFILND